MAAAVVPIAEAAAPVALKVIGMILAAEPAVVTAIHNLLTGTGTADDLTVLKADAVVWQSIADKAQAEIDKIIPPAPAPAPTPVVQDMPSVAQ